MKLNNHGWSLTGMLFCCAVILIALLIATFFSIRLAKDLKMLEDAQTEKITPEVAEAKIKDAALKYIESYYKEEIGSGTITVLASNLITENFLRKSDMIINENDVCNGYALIKKDVENNIEVKPYIKCSKYETKDFKKWRMGE